MDLIVSLVIVCVICWALWYVVQKLAPEPFKTPALVVIGVGALIWLLTHIRAIIAAIAGT